MGDKVFWSDEAAAKILEKKRDIVVNTGITPSGQIHVGNLRETLTADTIYRSLRALGAEPKFYWVADNYDPLRRVYPFLDEKVYTEFIGQPISDIPCPCGKHESYSDHFMEPFLSALVKLGVKLEVKKNDEMYKKGLFNGNVIKALQNKDRIREILKKATGKETEESWSPFNAVCKKCRKMTDTTVTGYDPEALTVDYKCACGNSSSRKIAGGGKLTWRVDWPARWQVLGVSLEPFGKDHASRGGSYDTGVSICKEIFSYEAPYPVVYEWISLKGMGDMSSSKGNVISADKMLEVIPPEVLKYSIIKTKPAKAIAFDPGLSTITLMDEFDDENSKNRNQRAYELSMTEDFKPVGVPFRHIVSLVQIARGDIDRMVQLLEKNGYEVKDREVLKQRADYAKCWLKSFAPEDVKFEVQDKVPEAAMKLPDEQKKALLKLSDGLREGMKGDDIQQLIYDCKDQMGMNIKDIFKAIYLAVLGKGQGPRAGMFLAMLDTEFLKNRFNRAGGGK